MAGARQGIGLFFVEKRLKKNQKPKFSVVFVAFVVFWLQLVIFQMDMFLYILLLSVVFVVKEEEKTTLNNTMQHLIFNALH